MNDDSFPPAGRNRAPDVTATLTAYESPPRQMVFHHWETMNGDPFPGGDDKVNAIVESSRKRKGLKEAIPALSEYEDKL